MTKPTKINLSFRRRLGLYYSRLMTLLKIIILLMVLILSFTNLFSVQRQKLSNMIIGITANYGFVFEHVIIQGQKNTSSSDIIDAIGTSEGVPIYALNINDIRTKIEDNPWIKAALVERRLPNTLYVMVIERNPIAIWQFQQKLYLIDEEGTRITSKNLEKFPNLLHVVGPDANIYALSLIEDLARHPDIAKRVVSAVRNGSRRWDLNLDQKINVKMPENNFNEAYDYLNSLNQKGKLFDQNYKTVNLRDESKYYIEKY